ncbi:MAG: ABC-type transport system involved in multi-copper enzyme maturation, permease component, partial [uncultured Solirubrobacteraceae bacterium]
EHAAHSPDHRRAHAARGVAPARADGGRGAHRRAAGVERLGVLPAGGGIDAHQRRGQACRFASAEPRDVRLQPDRCARHRVPRRADALRGDGIRHRAGRAGSADPSLGLPARQMAGAGDLRQRLHRPRRAGRVPGGPGDGRLLATGAGDRAGAARCADQRAADPQPPALNGHLADGVGRGRGRLVRRHLGRRCRRWHRRGAGQRRRRARRHRLADAPAHGRPVARGHARLPGPGRAGAGGSRFSVPQRRAADLRLSRVGRGMGGDGLGAGHGVVSPQGSV